VPCYIVNVYPAQVKGLSDSTNFCTLHSVAIMSKLPKALAYFSQLRSFLTESKSIFSQKGNVMLG